MGTLKINNTDTYEFINISIDPIKHPIAFKNRVDSLVRSGFTLEEAEIEAAQPIEMDLYYDQDTSLILADSGASESGVVYNTYTGERFEDDLAPDEQISKQSLVVTLKGSFGIFNNKNVALDRIELFDQTPGIPVNFSDVKITDNGNLLTFNINLVESDITLKNPIVNVRLKGIEFMMIDEYIYDSFLTLSKEYKGRLKKEEKTCKVYVLGE